MTEQFEFQRIDNGHGYLILDGENVADFTVVSLGPNMITIGSVYELHGYPQPVSRFSYAAFQNMIYVQSGTDLAGVDILTLE